MSLYAAKAKVRLGLNPACWGQVRINDFVFGILFTPHNKMQSQEKKKKEKEKEEEEEI